MQVSCSLLLLFRAVTAVSSAALWLDFAEEVTTNLSYSSADGYEFVQAEEGTEHNSICWTSSVTLAVLQNVGRSNKTIITGCSHFKRKEKPTHIYKKDTFQP